MISGFMLATSSREIDRSDPSVLNESVNSRISPTPMPNWDTRGRHKTDGEGVCVCEKNTLGGAGRVKKIERNEGRPNASHFICVKREEKLQQETQGTSEQFKAPDEILRSVLR